VNGGSRRRRTCLLGAAALALPLSQLGHQAAYLAHYGPAGLAYQSRSVHAYLPELVKASGALLGAVALAAVLLLGAARLASSADAPAAARRDVGRAEALGFLLCIQLQVFLVQEAIELLASGHHVGLLDLPLVWGVVGQLPVAALAALGVSWLSGRLVAAVRRLRPAPSPRRRERQAPLVQTWVEPPLAARLSAMAPATLVKRGPPVPSR
jgi:hypothetical protein